MRSAADQLKKLYGGKGKMRLKLFISVKGIKLFDYHTMVGREQSQSAIILNATLHGTRAASSRGSIACVDP